MKVLVGGCANELTNITTKRSEMLKIVWKRMSDRIKFRLSCLHGSLLSICMRFTPNGLDFIFANNFVLAVGEEVILFNGFVIILYTVLNMFY